MGGGVAFGLGLSLDVRKLTFHMWINHLQQSRNKLDTRCLRDVQYYNDILNIL